MNNTFLAIGVGGGTGLVLALADSMMFGTLLEIETVLKYGVPAGGLIWWLGRQFQKVQEELALAAKEREENKRAFESIGQSIHVIHNAIEEIRDHCKVCKEVMKPKTKFAVDMDTPKV